jgi:hypothetical protein
MRKNTQQEDRARMYQYPERGLRGEEFECQLPQRARAELGAKPRVVQLRRDPKPSPQPIEQAPPRSGAAISPPGPLKAEPTATPWFIGVLSAVILTGMVMAALNHSGGAGGQVWAQCTGSRATAITAGQPVTDQPTQQPAQPEVRRALPIDTVQVRRAELVVPRAKLVRLPGK